MNSFHIKCLKTILKITWRDFIPNEEILKRANILSIDNIIRGRRLRWAGHVSRMEAGRAPLEIAFSELAEGKKPKCRWMDVLKEDMKKLNINLANWRNIAANKNEWRKCTTRQIQNLQEQVISKKETNRRERHEEEEKCTWQCPLCPFSREGRTGRRYVLSHITQKHEDTAPAAAPITYPTTCTLCNTTCKSKSGHQSHLRSKHPGLYQTPTRQPIKIMPHASSQLQNSQASQPMSQSTSQPMYQSTPTPALHPPPTSTPLPQTYNQLQCRACQRICKSKAGLISHQRNATCRAVIEEMEASESTDP